MLPDGRVKIPSLVRLSYVRLELTGAYMLGGFSFPNVAWFMLISLSDFSPFPIENGQTLMFWIGREISPQFLFDVFGVSSLEQVDSKLPTLPAFNNPLSQKLQNLANYMQSQRSRHLTFHVVRQGMDQIELEFSNLLAEDKFNDNMNYVDYLCFIHRQIQHEVGPLLLYFSRDLMFLWWLIVDSSARCR